jgi:methyltransferase family protein
LLDKATRRQHDLASMSAGQQMPDRKRAARNRIKWFLRKLFESGQHFGLDILPRHFYSSVPDIRNLRKGSGWMKPFSMTHIAGADREQQMRFLSEICTPRRERLATSQIYDDACRRAAEKGYNLIDGQVLHCFTHWARPARIVQVGCGVSTAIILSALKDAGTKSAIQCIEPYPSEFLKTAAKQNDLELIPQKAQEVPLQTLTNLQKGDFLFVDSTHSVMPGSEVNRIMLEVIPRLPPGCFIHFHDIYFPYDYQRGLLSDELFFSSETPLLMALLTDNPKLTIRASLSMLHYAHPNELAEILPMYRPAPSQEGLATIPGEGHFPSLIYLETV